VTKAYEFEKMENERYVKGKNFSLLHSETKLRVKLVLKKDILCSVKPACVLI
jgi:hypothetical protein